MKQRSLHNISTQVKINCVFLPEEISSVIRFYDSIFIQKIVGLTRIKKYKWFGFFILLLTLTSCSEEFLEKSNPNSITSSSFYKTETDALYAVNAAYSALQRQGGYNRMGIHAYTVRSDEGVFTKFQVGAPALNGLDDFTVTSSTECVKAIWQDLYKGINMCNIVLEKIPDIAMNEELKTRILGEAYFLRGLYLFQLILYYGEEIPVVTKTAGSNADLYQPSAQPGEAYAQVEEDFTKAKDMLPNVTKYRGTSDLGRASKGAATAYLGKVYLFRKDYKKAAVEFKEIIDKKYGTYKLMPGFRDNHSDFNENNEESLFEVQYLLYFGNNFEGIDTEAGGESSLIEGECTMVRGVGMSNWNAMPNQKILAEWEAGDPRFYQTFWTKGGDKFKDVDGVTKSYEEYVPTEFNGLSFWRKWCRDWSDKTHHFDDPDNVRIMRYSDVLLMYAECLIEDSSIGSDWATYINMVRDRARADTTTEAYPNGGFIPTVEGLLATQPTINGKKMDSPRAILRHERFVELAFEFKRWDDIVRWNIGDEVLGTGYKYLLPIYQGDLDSNPNLKPNSAN
jgi:starch-binding outer membrane protein, SusD/RagB family